MALDLPAGSLVGSYRIEGRAGAGGMGVVYRAVHVQLESVVALKVIQPELAADQRFRGRFIREARLAASLQHASILSPHDFGEFQGALFSVSRFVEGSDLGAVLLADTRLDLARAARIIVGVSRALAVAHERKLIHRDIKPSNILLEDRDGREHALLTDFGLARSISETATTLTAPGEVWATPPYASPEQLRGEELDARTDTYSLGCVLYEALVGKRPFPRATTFHAALDAIQEPPPRVSASAPDVPEGIDEVVIRALAKDRHERYPTAGELGDALAAAAGRRRKPPPPRVIAPPGASPPYIDVDVEVRGHMVELKYGTGYMGAPALDDQLIATLTEIRSTGAPEEYGSQLFAAALPELVGVGYRAMISARDQQRPRVRLMINGAQLHALRWECLYDAQPPGRRIGAWASTPLSRALMTSGLSRVPVVEELKVLNVVASPSDLGRGPWEGLAPLDAEEEVSALEEALEPLGDLARSTTLRDPSMVDIGSELTRRDYDVLHLVAHISWYDDHASFVLADEDNVSDPVDEEAIATLLKDRVDHPPRLVVLKALTDEGPSVRRDARPAAIRLSHGSVVAAVVGFHDPLPADGWRRFLRTFYSTLFDPASYGMVDVAVNAARKQLLDEGSSAWDWTSPMVLLRGGGTVFRQSASPDPMGFQLG